MSNDSILLREKAERHKSLYFSDGNIVILAPRPDQPAWLFRVHKSVLSSHSRIFADMFEVCGTSGVSSVNNTNRHYDGVPLIDIPDNANHLESVLKILYYQSTLPWTPRSPYYPALVTPILELSRKYGIDRLREQIQKHVESDWPQTLKDWDKLENDIQLMTNDLGVQCIDDNFPEPASAIKLAHEFGILSILPAAFYHLSRLSILDNWDKMHAEPSLHPIKRTARWGLLSARDLRCLLLGREELAECLRGSLRPEKFRHRRINASSNRSEDCNVAEEVWKDICDKRIARSADPLALMESSTNPKVQLCPTCSKALKQVRVEIWEKLEKLFHLKEE